MEQRSCNVTTPCACEYPKDWTNVGTCVALEGPCDPELRRGLQRQIKYPLNGTCDPQTQSIRCQMPVCPSDTLPVCVYAEWTPWTQCAPANASACGAGVKTRTRDLVGTASGCSAETANEACEVKCCDAVTTECLIDDSKPCSGGLWFGVQEVRPVERLPGACEGKLSVRSAPCNVSCTASSSWQWRKLSATGIALLVIGLLLGLCLLLVPIVFFLMRRRTKQSQGKNRADASLFDFKDHASKNRGAAYSRVDDEEMR